MPLIDILPVNQYIVPPDGLILKPFIIPAECNLVDLTLPQTSYEVL